MSDAIGIDEDFGDATTAPGRRLIPMKVGEAVVYIEPFDETAQLQEEGDIEPVGVDPKQAFETASEALRECVRVVGDRVATVGSALTPSTIGMEFTLTFDVEGKATIVPVLLTGKAKSTMGIKVSAQWHPKGAPQGIQQ